MANLIVFNKPFNVLSQFTDSKGRATLADYFSGEQYAGFYAAGRLDYDSEGLLLLTDDGRLQQRIADPQHKMSKTYWVQVEGVPDTDTLACLTKGVALNDGQTRPARARLIEAPPLWQRYPPIRRRVSLPTAWLELTITEGRNRQVRRMTAAVGHPTLRLIRVKIGTWSLDDLNPGQHRLEQIHLPNALRNGKNKGRGKTR